MTTSVARYLLVGLLAGAAVASGCASAGARRAETWPMVDVLPKSPPSALQTKAAGAVLRPGDDGFMYVVGMTDQPAAGTPFVASYSGPWPIEDVDRPHLAAGRLVRTYGDGVGLVKLAYNLPDIDLEGLQIKWANEDIDAHLGKGLARVSAGADKGSRTIQLSIGKDRGVRDGDFYALLAEPNASALVSDGESDDESDGDSPAAKLQLSQRLTGVCMVQEATADAARCLVWPASSAHPQLADPAKGQQAVFLEHTFGAAPRDGVIQVAAVKGGDDGPRDQLAAAMTNYLDSVTEPKAEVANIDQALDASRSDFFRQADALEHLEGPQMVIGSTVTEVDGADHLIVTYTGVGSASGPGMVAAPPDHGVDLGPVDDLDKARVQSFVATVWAGMLVYRGQTSEALTQLHQLLSDPDIGGRLRWHLRDQYAMRWAALGHVREALWLVKQDEALGAHADDREAWLNALGTRVRLYDFLELPARAVTSAKRYLDARQADKPQRSWRSAVAMYAEMLAKDERVDDAMDVVARLNKACPDGCNGELRSHLAGIFWALPEGHRDVQQSLLDTLVDQVDDDKPAEVAATRVYQGLMSLNDKDFAQALIAFLEAKRLYAKVNNLPGQSRAQYFALMADLGRGEPQAAYTRGKKAQKIDMKLNDYEGVARLFERMSVLYTNPEFLKNPGPFLGGARQILSGAVESQIAMGDFGGAAENLLSLGSFMLKIGQPAQANKVLSEAIGYAISFKRFDVAALSHLYRGVIARKQGNMSAFRHEVEKAKLMAKLSDDPTIQQAVDDVLSPENKQDVPTQVL